METLFNGWEPFNSSLLGLFLTFLFAPEDSIFAKHPFFPSDVVVPKDLSEWSDAKKKAFMEEHLDEYWKKYFDKIVNPNKEECGKLDESLKDINAEIKTLNDKRQEIIDDWVLK